MACMFLNLKKITSFISILFIILPTLIAFPTKEEFLEKLYLISAGSKERYGKFLEDGILTDRYGPITSGCGPISSLNRGECPNLINCDKERMLNLDVNKQRGFFYFSLAGDFYGTRYNFDITYAMPLKHIYNKTINLSWDEFVTYDDIPLLPGSIVFLEESIPATDYLKNNNITTIHFRHPKLFNDDGSLTNIDFKAVARKRIVDAIQSAGGKFFVSCPQVAGYSRCDTARFVDEEKIDPKDEEAFFASIITEQSPYGFKNIATDYRYEWMENFSSQNPTRHRNYGFEFYAFVQNILKFIESKGVRFEDTGSFTEFIRAYLLLWDIVPEGATLPNFKLMKEESDKLFRNGISDYDQWRDQLNEISEKELQYFENCSSQYEKIMQEKVTEYKNQPLEALVDDLIKKEAYKYKNIPTNRALFKKEFINQTIRKSRTEAIDFIAGYKAFLMKTGSESPYPLASLESALIKIYDQIQSISNRTIERMQEDEKWISDMELYCECDIKEAIVFDTLFNVDELHSRTREMSIRRLEEEAPHLVERSVKFFNEFMDEFPKVYSNKEEIVLGDRRFTINLDSKFSKESSESDDGTKGVFLGNIKPGAEIVIKANDREVGLFSLEQRGTQVTLVEVEGKKYFLHLQVHKSNEKNAYFIDFDVEAEDAALTVCDEWSSF